MKYKTDMLVTETDSLDEWTSAWSELRGRHPFFLCGEISSKKVRILEFFKDIIPAIPTLKEIDVIIHSPGGKLDASFKAPYFFKTFCPNYVAVIPRYAKSGATLFSLGASEILMGQWAELGPLDPQISRSNIDRRYFSSPESALESFHALRFAQKEVTEYLDTFVDFLTKRGIAPRHAVQEAKDLVEATIGQIYTNVTPFELGSSGRALEVMERYCSKILDKSYDEETREEITEKLVWEYPDHNFFIDAEEARQIGLNVKIANQKEQALLDKFSKMLAKTNNDLCLGTLIPEEEGKESDSEEEGKESDSEDQGKESDSEDQGKESDSEDQGRESDSEDQGRESDSEDQGRESDSEDQGREEE